MSPTAAKAMKRTGHGIIRALLIAGLALGMLGASAEAADLLDGSAKIFSLTFTALIHVAAIVALIARWTVSKWLAAAVFLSDALLAITIAIELPEANTASHTIAAYYVIGASLTFALVAFAWKGDDE